MPTIVPCEILSSIFLLGQTAQIAEQQMLSDDESCYSLPGTREETEIPLEIVVSHVNRYWRAVALGTRQLWSHVFIQAGGSLPAVEEYLERSGGCFLDVSITSNGPSDGASEDVTLKMLDSALNHIHRWRRCSVDSFQEDIDSPLISRLASTRAPALEYLSIGVEFSDRLRPGANTPESVSSTPQIFTGGCPKLAFLHLRGLAIYFFRPPIRNVTTLRINHTKAMPVQFLQFRAILLACCSLLNLCVVGDIIGTQPLPQANSVSVPSLRSLSISSLRGTNYSGILLAIYAPLLEQLVLKGAQEHDLDQFFSSPHSSKFTLLRSLAFCDSDFTTLKYRNLFASFPSVSEFTFISASISLSPPNFLKVISQSPIDLQVPWPCLRTLSIAIDFDEQEEELLREAVERRMLIGCGLTRLRLGTGEEALSYFSCFQWLQQHVAIEVLQSDSMICSCDSLCRV
uniref:F-box domain-containing protein n=1 Tax=Moniliophthora roreri TaxID=221103 RepID=A0A0W0GBG4_MONRR